MSGPKDFSFTFIDSVLSEIRRRNREAQGARRSAMERTLNAARQRVAAGKAAEAAKRKAETQSSLERRARESRAALARATSQKQAVEEQADREQAAQLERESAAAAELQQAHDEKAGTLAGWAEALSQDSTVATFATADFVAWKAKADAITLAVPADFAARADALAAEAQAIHDRAGDVQARFETRNRLLRDVIETMKEMGYFVSDPYFANPSDPASPVILKATCGSETITTSVDLSSMVKSVWDGQEHEHCKDAFFTYVDAMKSRGVVVTPERQDLRDRPILRQKGANELPQSGNAERRAGR